MSHLIKKVGLVGLFVSAVLMFNGTAYAYANAMSPEKVVKETFDTLITKIGQNRERYRADLSLLYQMVDEVLTPTIHEHEIARKVLGKYSASATKQQKQEFTKEFKKLLLNTYAVLLLDYSGQQLDVKSAEPKGSGRMIVNTELVSSSGFSLPITFYMSNRGDENGTWTARNIASAGINFVTTFRDSFRAIIEQKGNDGIIAELKAKNQL